MHRGIFGPLLLIAASALTMQAARAAHTVDATKEAPASPMDERMRACTSCHGAQGQGRNDDYFPRIAGKPADYLFNQLSGFRDGARTYLPMGYLLAFLPDAYLHKIAQYFAELQPPYPTPDARTLSPAVLSHGETLVRHGDPARGIPACVACHGERMTGTQPGVPGLLGLHASYIAGQMGTWRSGTRHALAPDCMRTIAMKLNDRDIAAVSGWLARQPRPADPRPAPAAPARLPLACGSQPQ